MRRLRSESGVTLVELMVAMMIGTITILAVYGVLDTSIKQSTKIAGRVNATQRGRIAMDTITRQLRSQVCYSATVPALVSGTDTAVKFHVDLTDGSKPIEQHEIFYNPTARTLTERVWPGRGQPALVPDADGLAGRSPTSVVPRPAPNAPIFRYYAYNTRDAAAPGHPAADAAERDRPRPRGEDRDRLRHAAARRDGHDLPRRLDAPERGLRPRRGPQRPSTHPHMRLIPRIRNRTSAPSAASP